VQKNLLHTQNPSHNNNFQAYKMHFEIFWQLCPLMFTSGPFYSGTAYFTEESHYSTAVGERSIVISLSVCVCVSVCLWAYLNGTAGLIVTKFCVQITCGCGSVLLCRRCDMLCTSVFMDDVTFGRSGQGGATGYHLRHCDSGSGVWCPWMLCLFLFAAKVSCCLQLHLLVSLL